MKQKQLATKMMLILSPLLFTACVETTAPLCSTETQVDVPNLENVSELLVSLDPTQPSQITGPIQIVRTGRGEYKGQDGKTMKTCQLGRWVFAENQNERGHYTQQVVSGGMSGIFTFSQLIVSKDQLDAKGIVTEVIDPKGDSQIPMTTPAQSAQINKSTSGGISSKVLVIHNDAPETRQTLLELAKPNGIGFSLQ